MTYTCRVIQLNVRSMVPAIVSGAALNASHKSQVVLTQCQKQGDWWAIEVVRRKCPFDPAIFT